MFAISAKPKRSVNEIFTRIVNANFIKNIWNMWGKFRTSFVVFHTDFLYFSHNLTLSLSLSQQIEIWHCSACRLQILAQCWLLFELACSKDESRLKCTFPWLLCVSLRHSFQTHTHTDFYSEFRGFVWRTFYCAAHCSTHSISPFSVSPFVYGFSECPIFNLHLHCFKNTLSTHNADIQI